MIPVVVYLVRPNIPNSQLPDILLHLLSMILTQLDCTLSLGSAMMNRRECGPFRMWLEAHIDFLFSDSACWPEDSYVMWDIPESRAGSFEIDEKVRRWMEENRRQGLIERIKHYRRRKRITRSWTERATLYAQGKRGHWNPDDLAILKHIFLYETGIVFFFLFSKYKNALSRVFTTI